eukprot:2981404-Pyramimonas_sp.AAC.1
MASSARRRARSNAPSAEGSAPQSSGWAQSLRRAARSRVDRSIHRHARSNVSGGTASAPPRLSRATNSSSSPPGSPASGAATNKKGL